MKQEFDSEIAKELGIIPAIMLGVITKWVSHNKKTGKNKKNGLYWTYNTYKEWAKEIGYLSETQIRLALKVLEKKGLIIVKRLGTNNLDRTLWYTLPYLQNNNFVNANLTNGTSLYNNNILEQQYNKHNSNYTTYKELNNNINIKKKNIKEKSGDFDVPLD